MHIGPHLCTSPEKCDYIHNFVIRVQLARFMARFRLFKLNGIDVSQLNFKLMMDLLTYLFTKFRFVR